jgi:hypothetical protein
MSAAGAGVGEKPVGAPGNDGGAAAVASRLSYMSSTSAADAARTAAADSRAADTAAGEDAGAAAGRAGRTVPRAGSADGSGAARAPVLGNDERAAAIRCVIVSDCAPIGRASLMSEAVVAVSAVRQRRRNASMGARRRLREARVM